MQGFLFDNDISFRVVNALRELVDPAEVELFALRDLFSVDAKDADWIPRAGQRNLVIVSKDFNQRRRTAEHEALRANKCRAIYLRQSGKQATLYEEAARIIRIWPQIFRWAQSAPPSTLAKIDSSDRVVPLA